MYLNKNKHIITYYLIIAATVKIFGMIGNSLVRFFLVGSDSEIAALNFNIDRVGYIISCLQIVILVATFVHFKKQISHYRRLIPEDEYEEIAKLQKEVLKEHVSTLSLDQIDKLLKLWGFILIAMQVIYDLTTMVYEAMITYILSLVRITELDMSIFVAMYNSSHGLKYIGMMIALIIGMYVSGLFLNDRIMVMTSFALLAVFMIMFLFVNSSSFNMLGKSMVIVWTSVIFHASETVGLLGIALYIRYRYKGM